MSAVPYTPQLFFHQSFWRRFVASWLN